MESEVQQGKVLYEANRKIAGLEFSIRKKIELGDNQVGNLSTLYKDYKEAMSLRAKLWNGLNF